MPRSKPGALGTAIWRAGKGRLSHEQHIERCLEKMPDGWQDDGSGKNYPATWTGGDIAAWEAEMARVPVIRALIASASNSSYFGSKDRELFLKFVGTPELRPAALVDKSVTHNTLNVRISTAPDAELPQHTTGTVLPKLGLGAAGDVVEGEAIEVEAGAEGAGEERG